MDEDGGARKGGMQNVKRVMGRGTEKGYRGRGSCRREDDWVRRMGDSVNVLGMRDNS